MTQAVIVGAARTPIGRFQGGLGSVSAPQLGAACIRDALRRADVPTNAVQDVLMGNVLSTGVGQAPARQASRLAGLGEHVTTLTLNRVCGSGLQAVVLAAQSVRSGDREIAVAGGMESMSNAPHLLARVRSGYRLGHGEVTDVILRDGLTCSHTDEPMGELADRMAEKLGIAREEQDAFAAESYRRARAASKAGLFSNELVPVEIAGKEETRWLREDEQPFADDVSKLPTLRPAFSPAGTITAGNASTLNDGAAAVVVLSEDEVKRRRLRPMAKIVGCGSVAQSPETFALAPVAAIRRALEAAGLALSDIDLFEINQAFSASSLAVARALDLDSGRVDVNGGAVALGHPIGASGARILVTLLHALEQRRARRGLAALCIGGGEAIAVIVERAS